MKLYLIALAKQQTTIDLLASACHQKNIEYEVLNPAKTNPIELLNRIQTGDALYRISASSNYGCLELEYTLMSKDLATFYSTNNLFLLNEVGTDSMTLPKLGIPTPKTLNYIPRVRTVLAECVEQLGGYPIIIKASGGHSGVGVMRIDSEPSLLSVTDYLIKGDSGKGKRFVLKEYVEASTTARLIVLGDQVIASIEYVAGQRDFRSNAGSSCTWNPRIFSDEINAIAVKSTHALGLEFAGVDIMLTDSGPKVAEINFPCFFPDVQNTTGVDVAGRMLDHLLQKSHQITG